MKGTECTMEGLDRWIVGKSPFFFLDRWLYVTLSHSELLKLWIIITITIIIIILDFIMLLF